MSDIDSSHAGESRLRAYIAEHAIDAEIVAPGVPMPTVPLAAAAIGVPDEQIIKSVLFVAKDGRLVLAIASGTSRIDRNRLGEVLGMTKLTLADPGTVLDATGFPAGGVCPIGHATNIPVVMDRKVLSLPWVFGGAGSEETLLKISPDIVRLLTGATVADIVLAP